MKVTLKQRLKDKEQYKLLPHILKWKQISKNPSVIFKKDEEDE